MKTVARLSAEDRSDLFRNTANRMQMSDAIVEKDAREGTPMNSASTPMIVLITATMVFLSGPVTP